MTALETTKDANIEVPGSAGTDAPNGHRPAARTVEMRAGELVIDGQPSIVLCASVFPFRIPREQWAHRLAQVSSLGYTAVDVYIPWNYHEVAPQTWDLDGQRDIEHFLGLCAEHDLLVLARPGPYICAEWDGGGLPAWLGTRDDIQLRQNNPAFLAEVERWFTIVMPILASHQIIHGGAVALLQVENELDFFDCDDPQGYIAALRDSAWRHGIVVPLVACAGQGDVARAGGTVAGVAPAVNLYPSDDATDLEEQASYYEQAMRRVGHPLLVTETNRLHRTLKRLLVSGARLIAPFLQASGWNSDHGTAINNWGEPLAFMTHDYDFGGVVSPAGEIRPDGAEARALAGTIRALGHRLAAGVPEGPVADVVNTLDVPPHAMTLAGGGRLLCLTQVSRRPATARIGGAAAGIEVAVPAGTALLLAENVPLPDVGAILIATGGELARMDTRPGSGELCVTSRGEVTVLLSDVVAVEKSAGDLECTTRTDGSTSIVGTAGTATMRLTGGTLNFEMVPFVAVTPEAHPVRRLDALAAGAVDHDLAGWTPRQMLPRPAPLETVGAYHGAGQYVMRQTAPAGTLGLVLRGAGDLLQVRSPRGASPQWKANGGTDCYLPFQRQLVAAESVEVVTRIWGHSNFNDSRLPSLKLGALRGLSGVLAVLEVLPLDEGWTVHGVAPVVTGSDPPPRAGLGGWMTGHYPQIVSYRRDLPSLSGRTAALRMQDGNSRIEVFVDDKPSGVMTPLAPLLWLAELDRPRSLELRVHRTWGEAVGTAEMLIGVELTECTVASRATNELVQSRDTAAEVGFGETTLPLTVPVAAARWVRLEPDSVQPNADLVIRLSGAGILATALTGNSMLGRLWVGDPDGAKLKGGRGNLLLIPMHLRYLPLDLLLEATSATDGIIDSVSIGGPLDPPETTQ